ncbi:MAG: hydrogen peroxide-inducible genes activator [Balneolaceae bacterium]
MTLTQLSYIVAVDKYRHFATAAEKIYVTQPTLSMQIHKLEEELGVKIFDRSKSPVVPTEIGITIIEEAARILRQARVIEDTARLSDGSIRGTFRIGVIPTIAPYLIPLFLSSFVNKYPEAELVFEELLTSDILARLSGDTLDAGIIATPPGQNTIYTEDLYTEPFVGFLSLSHPLAESERLTAENLENQDIWLLNEGHCLREQTLKLCKKQKQNGNLSIRFESGNLETLKKLVEQNFGMTLMPFLSVHDFDKSYSKAVIKEFSDPVPGRKVRLAYGRKFLKQNMIKAFKEDILENLPVELDSGSRKIVLE